jgi:hypothetical protein
MSNVESKKKPYFHARLCQHISLDNFMFIVITIMQWIFHFLQVTKPEETPQVLPFISRMLPKVNPRIFRAQGRSTIKFIVITIVYLL